MMNDTQSGQFVLTKRHIVIPLLVLQIYPLYIGWTAYRLVPSITAIVADLLGAEIALPVQTQTMQATYRWWITIPVVMAGLALLCFHRKIRTMSLPSAILVLTLVSSFGMRVILAEGCFAPMVMTISQLSQ